MSRVPFKVVTSPHLSSVTYASPNEHELQTMAGIQITSDPAEDLDLFLQDCVRISQDLLKSLQVILVTLGELGVLVIRRGDREDSLPLRNDPVQCRTAPKVSATYYPVVRENEVKCVSGENIGYIFPPLN